MEGNKQSGSSFASDLFGSKESSGSSSSGIFSSIFAPSSKVLGRESVHSESADKKQDPPSQVWKPTTAAPGDSRSSEVGSQSTKSRDMNPFYQEEKVQPCHLSSSIYYGGQDVYSRPQNTQSSGYTTVSNVMGNRIKISFL